MNILKETYRIGIYLIFERLFGQKLFESQFLELYDVRYKPLFGEKYKENKNCGMKLTKSEFFKIKNSLRFWIRKILKNFKSAPFPIMQIESWNLAESYLSISTSIETLPSYICNCMTHNNIFVSENDSLDNNERVKKLSKEEI